MTDTSRRTLRRGSARIVAALSAATLCAAAAQTAAPGPSLDELLGLEPDAPTPAGAPTDAGPSTLPDPSDPVAPLPDAAPEPFAAAAEQMEAAAERLDGDRDPGLDTQRLQEDVLARLDQLIADAINNAPPPPPGGGGGGSGTPDNGDAEPGEGDPANSDATGPPAGGPPGAGETPASSPGASPSNGGFSPGQVGPIAPGAGPLREVRTEWGALPPRLRDELSNGLDEPFSPVYRRQTEAFYRRLAEDAAD